MQHLGSNSEDVSKFMQKSAIQSLQKISSVEAGKGMGGMDGGEVKTVQHEAKQVIKRNDGSSHRTKNSPENLKVAERGRQLLRGSSYLICFKGGPRRPKRYLGYMNICLDQQNCKDFYNTFHTVVDFFKGINSRMYK